MEIGFAYVRGTAPVMGNCALYAVGFACATGYDAIEMAEVSGNDWVETGMAEVRVLGDFGDLGDLGGDWRQYGERFPLPVTYLHPI